MATPQNSEPELSKIVGSVSKIAGVLVGTAVVAGKRIIDSVKLPGEGPSDKRGKKTTAASVKRRQKEVRKTETKRPKTKKKKVVKRKRKSSSNKSEALKKKPIQSPIKKKKKRATPRKVTAQRKTKKTVKIEGASPSQDSLISGASAGADVSI